jgi:hypothetical protein
MDKTVLGTVLYRSENEADKENNTVCKMAIDELYEAQLRCWRFESQWYTCL